MGNLSQPFPISLCPFHHGQSMCYTYIEHIQAVLALSALFKGALLYRPLILSIYLLSALMHNMAKKASAHLRPPDNIFLKIS